MPGVVADTHNIDGPVVPGLVHSGMGGMVEGSLSPGNASLSSPATTFTGESSLSPPLACMGPGAGLPYVQQFRQELMPSQYRFAKVFHQFLGFKFMK